MARDPGGLFGAEQHRDISDIGGGPTGPSASIRPASYRPRASMRSIRLTSGG
jgi:hypothetical protein